jgi:hypothetical protein
MTFEVPFVPTPLAQLAPYHVGQAIPPPRPLVKLRTIGSAGSRDLDALVDSGSLPTVLPLGLASDLGVALLFEDQDGRPFAPLKWRGNPFPRAYGEIHFELYCNQGSAVLNWPALVWFCNLPVSYALLGCQSFLEYFDVTLTLAASLLRLDPNPSFPGTVHSTHAGSE